MRVFPPPCGAPIPPPPPTQVVGFGLVLLFICALIYDMESPFVAAQSHLLTRTLDAAVAGAPPPTLTFREIWDVGAAHITCDIVTQDFGPSLAKVIRLMESGGIVVRADAGVAFRGVKGVGDDASGGNWDSG